MHGASPSQEVKWLGGQHLGGTLAGEDGADDAQAGGGAGDVGDDVMELNVHLGQRLLHMLDVRGRVLKKALALTHVGSQLRNLSFGSKAGPQQSKRMEPLQPLGIADIGLAPRHVLGVTRVDKKHGEPPFIEKLENRNPVDAGRFHDDRSDVCSLRDFSRALYPLAGRRRAPRRIFFLDNSPAALAAGRATG